MEERGRKSFSLATIHERLLQASIPNVHTAMGDVDALHACLARSVASDVEFERNIVKKLLYNYVK